MARTSSQSGGHLLDEIEPFWPLYGSGIIRHHLEAVFKDHVQRQLMRSCTQDIGFTLRARNSLG